MNQKRHQYDKGNIYRIICIMKYNCTELTHHGYVMIITKYFVDVPMYCVIKNSIAYIVFLFGNKRSINHMNLNWRCLCFNLMSRDRSVNKDNNVNNSHPAWEIDHHEFVNDEKLNMFFTL